MKLLFDNNFSHKLISRLDDLFSGSTHVMLVGLDESDDEEIWNFLIIQKLEYLRLINVFLIFCLTPET